MPTNLNSTRVPRVRHTPVIRMQASCGQLGALELRFAGEQDLVGERLPATIVLAPGRDVLVGRDGLASARVYMSASGCLCVALCMCA